MMVKVVVVYRKGLYVPAVVSKHVDPDFEYVEFEVNFLSSPLREVAEVEAQTIADKMKLPFDGEYREREILPKDHQNPCG